VTFRRIAEPRIWRYGTSIRSGKISANDTVKSSPGLLGPKTSGRKTNQLRHDIIARVSPCGRTIRVWSPHLCIVCDMLENILVGRGR